jgi:hypothetical protein
MARRLWLCGVLAAAALGCAGEPGAPGAKGDPGHDGVDGASSGGAAEPSISAVVPASVFLARAVAVTLSGAATAWTAKAKVDFGPGITVEALTVASPTALVAKIRIAADAAAGPRDVAVADGEKTLVYKGAFDVEAPLELGLDGSPAQGSIFVVRARGLDFATPFDTTEAGSPFNPTYPNLSLGTSPGVTAELLGVSEYAVKYRMFVDVDAATTSVKADLASGPKADAVDFPFPAAFAIAARAATPLVPGVATTISLAHPGDSALLSYTPPSAALTIVDVGSSTTELTATPAGYFLPESGKFADQFAVSPGVTFVSSSGAKYYAVYTDYNAKGGYDLDVTAHETTAQGSGEKEPNDSKNLAISNGAVTPPWVTLSAGLEDASDEDWFAVTVDAAHVGKSIHVQTTGLDQFTDTVVDIFEQQGNTLIPLGPNGKPSDDSGLLDELTSLATASAGTYFVKVSASPFFDAAHTKYDVIIRLE